MEPGRGAVKGWRRTLGLSWDHDSKTRPVGGSVAFGLSWDHHSKSRIAVVAAVITLFAGVLLAVPAPARADGALVSVIVEEAPGAGDRAEALVVSLGGSVTGELGIISSFTADVPETAIHSLASHPDVVSVTQDGTVQLMGRPSKGGDTTTTTTIAPSSSGNGFGETNYAASFDGSMYHVTRVAGAEAFWSAGYTGEGVDVALIDSGVVPVEGLTVPGKVVNGPDLSFESQYPETIYLDTFGHGTHMAGIIAGRDAYAPTRPKAADSKYFIGMAPGARIVNVKVASHDGSVDVSQVIAAVDWVVQHRNDNGMKLKVLNLSFGTDGVQDYQLDPLSKAVEVAWAAGITVVVATGNDGNNSALRNPAADPHVISVGAADTLGTDTLTDDVVASFANCGSTRSRSTDLVAPGVSIVSLRSPGSYADSANPSARIGDRFFKGTGTSQAAAVVSGAVALVYSKYPTATPDQVKALLTATATPLNRQKSQCQGGGELNLAAAYTAPLPKTAQTHEVSSGTGTLEGARGSFNLEADGISLEGEYDIFGNPFNSTLWAAAATAGTSWDGGDWNNAIWTGASWSGASWSGASWSGASWSGASWSGASWSGASWSGASWSGASWSGASWSGASWSGASWSGASWSSHLWGALRPIRHLLFAV